MSLIVMTIAAATATAAAPTEIVVTGRGLAETPGSAAYDVIRIDRKRIEQSASGRLEDVLRDVAGLQSFRRSDSRSANATSQSLLLRGMGGNASSRALLILDGVPQSDPFGGWISFPAYSTDRLGSIRVTRGGGSSLWGPGALSGTVELESATPSQLGAASGSIAYGSRHSLAALGSVLVGDSHGFVTVSGAFARGDGFIPIVAARRGPIDRAAAYRQTSGAIRAVVGIAREVELQGNVSLFDDQRERGLPHTDNRGRGVDGSVRLVGSGATRWSLLGYVQRRKFESQSASVNTARTTATLTNNQFNVPSRGWGGRAEIEPIRGEVDVRLGADLRHVKGETDELYQYVAGAATRYRQAGGESLTAGGFADATWQRGGLVANLSGRLDHWSIRNGRFRQRTLAGVSLSNVAYADRSGWQPTGRGAIAWHDASHSGGRAAVYRGWRLPTLNELYRPFRAGADATAANAALAPETSFGGEIGGDLGLGGVGKASVTLFAARLDHAIANVTLGRGPGLFPDVGFVAVGGSYRKRQNLDSIHSRGVEFDLAGDHGSFDWRLSYAYTRARVEASGAARVLDGKAPAQLPRHSGSATLGWSGPRDLHVSFTGRLLSSQYEDDLNQRVLGRAATLDGAVVVPVTRHVLVDLRAENLFDRQVDAALGSDGVIERALPRTLWVGLRIR